MQTRRACPQATAKSFLGFTLYINDLAHSSFNEETALLDNDAVKNFNQTAFCLGLENFTSTRG